MSFSHNFIIVLFSFDNSNGTALLLLLLLITLLLKLLHVPPIKPRLFQYQRNVWILNKSYLILVMKTKHWTAPGRRRGSRLPATSRWWWWWSGRWKPRGRSGKCSPGWGTGSSGSQPGIKLLDYWVIFGSIILYT